METEKILTMKQIKVADTPEKLQKRNTGKCAKDACIECIFINNCDRGSLIINDK